MACNELASGRFFAVCAAVLGAAVPAEATLEVMVLAQTTACFGSSGAESADAAPSRGASGTGSGGDATVGDGAASSQTDATSQPGLDGGQSDTLPVQGDGAAGLAPISAAVATDAGATVVVSASDAAAAAPLAFGQNYWSWVTSYGDQVDHVQSGAAAMKIRLLRAGGHNNDNNTPEPFTSDAVDRFVKYARAIGAEPVLQVPLLLDVDGGRPTAASAAAMVTYANVTQQYGIKYWEIGNEPDLYSDQGDLPAGYTAASYCTDFASFSDAMRAADPTIKLLGPELSYKYIAGNDWLTPFLKACGSKVDVVTVHRYPFAAANCTIANAMNDGAQFRATLLRLRQLLDAQGLTSTPLAITESNLSYQGDPTLQTGAAPLGSLYAGLWTADVTGIALEENVWSMMFWSLDEGFLSGFFTSDTFQPRPAAYTYDILTNYFGPQVLKVTTAVAGLSAYASRDDGNRRTTVLLINRAANDAAPVVGFQGFTAPLATLSVPVPGYSLRLVQASDDGTVGTLSYGTQQAAQGAGPVQP